MNGRQTNPQNNRVPAQRPQSGGTPTKRPQGTPPRRRRRFRFKPNKEGMQALLILVLLAALIITVLVLTIKGIINAVTSDPESTTTAATTTGETSTEPPVVAAWRDGYVNEIRPNTDVAVGDLILVNFEQSYPLTDAIKSKLTSLSADKAYGEYFVLREFEMKIRGEIITELRQMITDLVTAQSTLGTSKDGDRVIIVSGHRTTDYQQNLYDNQVTENYVAIPGHSEHHTGLAVDLKVYTSKQKTVEFREDEQAWMEANCANYGFVVRYDGAKFELTGILDETWHFRYVGKPHAQYMTDNNLCLEEYLTMLRTHHNVDSEAPLTYTTADATYEIYYVPASASETTDIPVPKADSVTAIDISGDNMGGFIVTVTK